MHSHENFVYNIQELETNYVPSKDRKEAIHTI